MAEDRSEMPPVVPFVGPGEDLWVFGYGSLIWKPGFDYAEQRRARLYGFHRRFCIYSHRHRGTPDRPGLVLGLAPGGSCHGLAYRVAAPQVAAVTDYLWEREMVTGVYRPTRVALRLEDGRHVTAGTFVADPDHRQYCAERDPAAQIALILQGHGRSGPNTDYLFNTVDHLTEMGIHDPSLALLARRLRAHLEDPARYGEAEHGPPRYGRHHQ
jgi:cation transport protein ChaC